MCQNNCTCHIRRFRTHLKSGQAKRTEFEGRDYLIVPVVMARADVVMNGGLIPVEEFFPAAWDGRPVVIDHPQERGEFIGASRPDVLTRSAIGQIFHTRVDGHALKAEAWIDIAKAEDVQPGLVSQLENGDVQLDVSTGYFADPEPKEGREGGRWYKELHRNIRPDHLAFLPNDRGACSWEDGCGVRFNERQTMKFNFDALKSVFNAEQVKALMTSINDTAKRIVAHARGEDDDARQIRSDLISDDRSPFLPDDEMALQYMSAATLAELRNTYLKRKRKANAKSPSDEEEEETEDVDEKKVKSMIDESLATVTKSVADVANAVKAMADSLKANVLSDEDKAALASARKRADEYRAELVTKITTNSSMTKEQVEKFDTPTLETIANGLKTQVVTNFAARPAPRSEEGDKSDPALKAMTEFNTGVVSLLSRKKEAA